MTTKREDALNLLAQCYDQMINPQHDIRSILRNCQYISQLLDLTEQFQWFRLQLQGYPKDTPKPNFRIIHGISFWEPDISGYEKICWEVEKTLGESIPKKYLVTTSISEEIFMNIDWIIQISRIGNSYYTGEVEETNNPRSHNRISLRKKHVFMAEQYKLLLERIDSITFEFITNSLINIKFGDAVTSIWEKYQQEIEKSLIKINMLDRIMAIEENIHIGTSQNIRLAIYGCRNLYEDIANYLWQDTRETYNHLDGENGFLCVTRKKPKNRFAAYLHQKGITGKRGEYLRKECDRIWNSISTMYDLLSLPHETVPLNIAYTAILGFYFLIGELALNTDFQPIIQYK